MPKKAEVTGEGGTPLSPVEGTERRKVYLTAPHMLHGDVPMSPRENPHRVSIEAHDELVAAGVVDEARTEVVAPQ